MAVCQTALENFDSTKKLGTLAPKVQEYRCSAIIAAAKSNTPISEIVEIGRSWVDKYSGYSLGSRTDIVTAFSKPILNSLIQRIRSILCGGGCFPEYSVIFDGTPSFAEAEAVVIRCVTKNWEVIELLVRCSLFKNKLNSETLANHILDTIVNRVDLKLKNWLCTQQGRAQINKSCLRLILKSCSDAQPTKNYYCSHGLSNCGK